MSQNNKRKFGYDEVTMDKKIERLEDIDSIVEWLEEKGDYKMTDLVPQNYILLRTEEEPACFECSEI